MLLISFLRTIFEDPGSIPDDIEWDMVSDTRDEDLESRNNITNRSHDNWNGEEDEKPLVKGNKN